MRSPQQNRLRIIGGQWRGRKLAFPDEPGLRPTPDRIRETLFNWLNPSLYGARCLDLFGGSGALSFEALSRGAQSATIIDQSPRVIDQLQNNLADLSFESVKLVRANTLHWLESLKPGQLEPFDIIFLDPPFNLDIILPCCHLLESRVLIKKDTFVYIETEAQWKGEDTVNWTLHRKKMAGQVASRLFIVE